MILKNIAFSAYAVSDIPKARKFYEGFLGLKAGPSFPAKDDSFFIEYWLPNENQDAFVIGKAEEWPVVADAGNSVAFEVDSVDEWVEKIKKENIPVKMGPHDFPSCKMIVILDPDKNRVTLHERKPGHK
jgi:catechol 2,3-dioxygenase-like lactoylglutathione lyase family enzyme